MEVFTKMYVIIIVLGGIYMTRILLAEDEISLQKILAFDLKAAGYDVTIFDNGLCVKEEIKNQKYDIYLLDWMLPEFSGIEISQEIRKIDQRAHIIMITANDEEFHKIEAFDVGVDDYLSKPFSSRELVLRIKAATKKQLYYDTQVHISEQTEKNQIKYKNLTIDLKGHCVFEDNIELSLTLKEYELLLYLVKHQGIAISRHSLLDTIWGYDYDGDTRTVDVHIFKLRAKINNKEIKFKTIRGVGYLLEKSE